MLGPISKHALQGAAVLALFGLSGCTVDTGVYVAPPEQEAVVEEPAPPPQQSVVVDDAPPPPQYEVVTAAPGPNYVWVGGEYYWVGGRYVWHRGYWAPGHGHHGWVAGGWEHGPHGWYHVDGHWR